LKYTRLNLPKTALKCNIAISMDRSPVKRKNIRLSSRLIRVLKRESRGSEGLLDSLASEAVARRWFISNGVPCWRTNQSPSAAPRYGLLFRSGRRAVVSSGCRTFSFDEMAAARCQYLVRVRMDSDYTGTAAGYFNLRDMRMPGNILWKPDLQRLEPRTMDNFPELARRPRHFRISYILGSLRLLLAGEPSVPDAEISKG